MKQRYSLLIALSILISGCAASTESPTERPTTPPATGAPTSAPPPQTVPATPAAPDTPTETPSPPKEIWLPPVGSSFAWQLEGEINTSFDAAIYDLDAFETEASLISGMHAEGKKVFCYISVGSWEDWRPDAADFPSEIIGKDYEGWAGEKWLDIRQIDLLAPIMRTRLELCAEKGFDGVEPDNIDLHWADTGFEISYADQLAYNIWLAEEAHARGLSIGLKNNEDQARDLLPYFDWALTEDCFTQGWCDELAILVEAGKPVFAAEYTDEADYEKFQTSFCPQAARLGFYAFLKNRNLDAYMAACP